MTMDRTFHYPPELFNLMVDTIPLLNKSKKSVFIFFRGAGVKEYLMKESFNRWSNDKDSITKYEIVRQILLKLNEKGDECLGERREVLKRVVEFESFSSCWPEDQLKAKGLVAEIQKVVSVKDSFIRMKEEKEKVEKKFSAQKQLEIEKALLKKEAVEKIKRDLCALFNENNRQKRGKALESVLNELFKTYEILLKEAFSVKGNEGEGIVEQIDGVIEVDGYIYFVEMKWWKDPIGVQQISEHLVRIYHRAEGRAIIISGSDYTLPAVSICKDALQQKVVILFTLEEIIMLLENQGNLIELIKNKAVSAIVDKNPFKKYTIMG